MVWVGAEDGLEWGWNLQNGQLQPIMMNKDPAPLTLLKNDPL